MGFLIVGLLATALKALEFSFFANLSWWIVLTPYALAVLWWWFADASGYTSRKVAERDEARKQARIDRQRRQMGLPERPGRKGP